jgi:hypothetical protein
MSKQLKTIVVILVLVMALVLVGIIVFSKPSTLTLVGAGEEVIELNGEYIEAGTNISGAEIQGQVDTSKVGDYVITYTYKDQKVSRTVHVVDSASLVVGLRGSENTKVRQGDPYIESGAFAIDKNEGAVPDYEITGNVDTDTPGEYEVVYTFSKGYVNKSISRKVQVIEKDDFIEDTDGVSVLMYHYVYTQEDQPENLNSNYILDTKLEEQLKYLKENDYYFPSFRELRAYADGKIALPEKSVILTFDDGQYGFLAYGIPLLNKYEIPATAFIIGTREGESKIKEYASQYVGFESHSYDMHKGGGNIGHGGIISALTKEQIKADLEKEIAEVGSRDAFAYPFGDVTEDGKAAIAETNILCAFTTNYGRVKVGDDFRVFNRVRVLGESSLASYKTIL